MSIDYGKKAEVIESGFVDLQRKISKAFFAESYFERTGHTIYSELDYDTAYEEYLFLLENCPDEWNEACKINYATYKRVKRLKDRIAYLLSNGDCTFLTLTFTDEVLATTSPETRRRYITRFLKRFDVPYIANKDFGSKNGREHYHAIIQSQNVDYSLYEYGSIDGEKIYNRKNDDIKLAKYISKLTNHAIKETCNGSKIIYSKN
jgi:hypothetical protein